ncbi:MULTISPECIES: type II secretion system F family protein [unclassified Arthrobacter]|uniref:type II secretion system F family protein n=1 Tax=unclassified Arthrobacter TaxID=235627 RepID=UPI001C84D64D|nr:type II secretion system F family protein [Arthrobacter sp. MAHUQ-56]MBX7445196.1 type II secretion system F family protein [Arthrobacter sp. MAHUQ-56]
MIIAIGSAILLAAVCLVGVAVLLPSAPSVPLDRRRPFEAEPPSSLSRLALSGVRSFERLLAGRHVKLFARADLENAGLRLSQAEFFLLVGIGACIGMLVGVVTVGPLVGLLLALLAPFVGKLFLGFLSGKRRAAFDGQLGDTLQLLSGSLRAGHSILRAIDAAATESQKPSSEEMRRVITETSLGRDLLAALNDTADRMKNEDFVWISQAIQINREVGGNLAEVLDQVNETIRERAEIKGHIKALAAEGKFSAYILIAMPFGIVAMLLSMSPNYMNSMFTHPLGWAMIGASIVLMTIGALWMRKIIDLKF